MKHVARMRVRGAVALAVVLAAAALAVPSVACAQTGVPASIAASPAVPATGTALGTWALDFTLPTFGKSGCLVCHGDPALVVPSAAGDASFWIDQIAYDKSAHAKLVCTACHLDFGYKAPHTNGNWRATAKQSCVNCHDKEFRDYSDGAHAVRPTADRKPDPKAASKPLCGDCHGAHDIMPLTVTRDGKKVPNRAGVSALHASSEQVCGKSGCHKDYWDNYTDYYHGQAYRTGSPDAPACWDCHGAHTVIASSSTVSPTNVANLPNTCGSGATGALNGKNGALSCHQGATDALDSYVALIHTKQKVVDGNPIRALLATIRSWFGK